MKLPTRQEAARFIMEAESRNPGNWALHSQFTASAAEAIAKVCSHLDAETAYIMGLLHDIGRREGITYMRHALDGYRFLKSMGYEEIGRICITHTFWLNCLEEYPGKWDCSEEETAFLKAYLDGLEYDDYDRLIQLCDCLALPSGFCLLEKRLVDVALRYGTTEYTTRKWRSLFLNKEKLERQMGCSLYDLLPGVMENSFK